MAHGFCANMQGNLHFSPMPWIARVLAYLWRNLSACVVGISNGVVSSCSILTVVCTPVTDNDAVCLSQPCWIKLHSPAQKSQEPRVILFVCNGLFKTSRWINSIFYFSCTFNLTFSMDQNLESARLSKEGHLYDAHIPYTVP